MGNSQQQPKDTTRIIWPIKPFVVNAKEFSSSWKQDIILAPPPEWYFRGSLKSLCLHAILRHILLQWMQHPPKQVDKKIQTEFLKLSPDLRQELWAHATKWLLRNQHPPTPPGRRPIMWEFEADKYYDPKTQDLWGQMARILFNHIGGVENLSSDMFVSMHPSANTEFHMPLERKCLKRVRKLHYSTYDTNPQSLKVSLDELQRGFLSKRLTELSFAINYDKSIVPYCGDVVRLVSNQCRSLTSLKLSGIALTQDVLDYLADNLTDKLQTLLIPNNRFEDGAVADSALVTLSQRLTNLSELDISGVTIESTKFTAKMFKYMTHIQSLKMGAHKYYAVEPQPDWELVWDDVTNNMRPANPEAEAKMMAFNEATLQRNEKGSAALLKGLCKYFVPENHLVSFTWEHRDLAGTKTIEYLARFVSASTKLQQLDISGLYENHDASSHMFVVASELPHLENFVISRFYPTVSPSSAQCLFKEASFPSLTALDLSSIQSDDDEFILKLVAHWPVNLSEFRLVGSQNVTDASLVNFLKLATNLERLELSYCSGFTDAVVHAVVENCIKLKKLHIGSQKLTGSTLSLLSSLTNLTDLDIARWPDTDPKDIFHLALHLTNLQRLSVASKGRPAGKAAPKWDTALKSFPGISLCRNIFY